jgi:putative ABC transport system permease protein
MHLRLALQMSLRDWRSAELRLLAAALVLAVAAVASVGFFVDRVRQGMQRDAAQYLGGDAALESDRPLDPRWQARARALGLRSSFAVSFPSMALAEDPDGAAVLVNVKAVSGDYPLRGALRLDQGQGPREIAAPPGAGTAWVDPQLLQALGLRLGSPLHLGRLRLRIAATIAFEPDRRLQVVGFAPHIIISGADLDASGLIQPASRASYRWMIAGEPAARDALVAQWKSALARGQHLETLEDGRPELQRNLDRAQRFLGLAALMTVLVAAVAVSSAARRFSARRLDACALLRCFGLSQAQIAALFAWEFALVGLAASLVGVLAGLALHQVLLRLLAEFLQRAAPWPGPVPALQGLFCGMVLVLGFGLPPVEQLRRVSALRVLRREVGPPGSRTWLSYLAGGAGFALLLLWTAGELRLGLTVGGGFLACLALFVGLGYASLVGLGRLRRGARLPLAWRHAIAALQRRPGASVAQTVALAMGLMALLLLAIVRGDLVDEWRSQAPPKAPNRFVINIQPDQTALVAAQLQSDGVTAAALEPMVRGRLVAVDDRALGPDSYEDERARNLVEREFNLSYRSDAPAHNEIVQGRWFAPGAAELSIEEGIAQRLHIGLGQRLRFDVAGTPVSATVTSIRHVEWDSMRVNFFVIMAPLLLQDLPQTFITSFYLPPDRAGRIADLVRRFPNLTVIDTDLVLAQLRAMLDQLIAAVQFLFLFAVAAGMLVLYTAMAASQDERVREAALLRALGASRRRLAGAQAAEMVLVGALAGAMAAAGAVGIAWAMAHYAFDFAFTAHAWVALAGLAGGIAAALAGAWPGLRRVLAAPPLQSLRDA